MEERLALRVDSIMKIFLGIKTLDGVHLDVRGGEVHTLYDENGASKSTLIKTIAGAQGYTSGRMYVNGEEVAPHSTKDAGRKDITMIYQEFNMVRDLSMVEDMYLGRFPRMSCGTADWKELCKSAQEELNRLGLRSDCRIKVRSLSVAESQMTEVAKCLTVGVKVIIMDEPTAILTGEKIQILFKIITGLEAEGISILYISHHMSEISQISDRLAVFRDGRYIATKDIGHTNYDEVVSTMVGRSVTNLYSGRDYREDETVLELRNICGESAHSVSIRLRRGKILGVAGLLSSGTIELSKVVYGALPIDSEEIYINGEKKDCSSPKRALKARIGFMSDDRKQEELVLIHNIRENVSLLSLDKIAHFIHLGKKLETRRINAQVKRFDIKASSLQQPAGKLGGDSQQEVAFTRMLKASPSILILDEPTRGVDMGAKAGIYQIMDELTRTRKSIILTSTNLPEVIGMSDRVVIMKEGRAVLEIPKSEMDQEIILTHTSGGVSENE